MTFITRSIPTVAICLLGLVIPQGRAFGLLNKQQPTNQYPDDVVSGFISSCTSAAAQDKVDPQLAQNICTCYVQEIQNEYTYQEFEAIDREVAQGQPLPPAFEEIVKNCISRNVPSQE